MKKLTKKQVKEARNRYRRKPMIISDNETATAYRHRDIRGVLEVGFFSVGFKKPLDSADYSISADVIEDREIRHKCIAWVNFNGTK